MQVVKFLSNTISLYFNGNSESKDTNVNRKSTSKIAMELQRIFKYIMKSDKMYIKPM